MTHRSLMFPRGGAYCFMPGIWFGKLSNPHQPPIDALEDVVAHRSIRGIGHVRIWREGLVWFDFSDGEFKTIAAIEGRDEADEVLLLLAERGAIMTTHSNCVSKAALDISRIALVAGTEVTPLSQIMVPQRGFPTSNFRPFTEVCVRRFHYKERIPFLESTGLAATTRMQLDESVAGDSLLLLESLSKQQNFSQIVKAVNLLVRAESNLRNLDFSVAHILAWTACEICLDAIWADPTIFPRVGSAGGSTKKQIDTLSQAGLLTLDLAATLHLSRRDRNKFVHQARPIEPRVASNAVSAAGKMVKIAFGYGAPVSPSYGTFV